MLFVFGKRAKQMRLNKVSELIHNSNNHQNLDSAGVSVQFEEIIDLEDESYETVPGSDFMITRVAFRDNLSKYNINERLSNFTKVTKKIKGKGVDLDNNRFLILQGEIEQISLMRPKAQGPHDEGFLEYLEDIIGTNKYVENIDKLNKQVKMDESNQELKEFESVHEKHKKRQEVLDNELRVGKEKFKEFERQDEKQTDHIHKLKEKVKTPEDVPRLFDLIRVMDESMKLAFYAALGNTVVAKDLDQATRIAYGGNREFRRVVTLDGALFEKSGTMSGGGGKPRGGRMGTSIRATGVSSQAVSNAENELSKIIDMLSNICEKIGNAVRQYRAAENEVSRLGMELAKSKREIESLNSEHNYLEKQLASLEAASQPKTDDIDRLKELKKIISKEEKEIENLMLGKVPKPNQF